MTSQVGTLLIPFGGAFKGKPAEGLTRPSLAHTSKNSMPVDLIIATLSGEPSTRGFQPSGEEMPLAIRLSGKFQSGVPGRPAAADGAAREEGAKKDDEKKAAAEPHLKESAAENSIVLVADVDMLTDGAAVEVQDVFGQRVVVPRNGNLAFAQGLVEQFSGDRRLISAAQPRLVQPAAHRDPGDGGRARSSSYLGKIKELEDSLNQTQEKLQELQKAQGRRRRAPSSRPSSRSRSRTSARRRSRRARELKELRKNLRVETDRWSSGPRSSTSAWCRCWSRSPGSSLALSRRRRSARSAGCSMNRKQFLILVLALLVLGGAGIALFWQDIADYRASGAKIGAKLLPEFKLADVAQMRAAGREDAGDARAQGNRLGRAGARRLSRQLPGRSAISWSSWPSSR